jgi:hypothetical protein
MTKDQIEGLQEVVALNQAVKPAEAEQKFKSIVSSCSQEDLHTLAAQISIALNSFFPKRRRSLEKSLNQHPEEDVHTPEAAAVPRPVPPPRYPKNVVAPRPSPENYSPPPAKISPPGPEGKQSTPNSIARALAEVAQLNSSVKPGKAEEKFRRLVEELDSTSIQANEEELRRCAHAFLPKRRQALRDLLDSRLSDAATPGCEQNSPAVANGSSQAARPAAPSDPEPLQPAPAAASLSTSPAQQAPSPKRPVSTRSANGQLMYMKDRFSADLDNLSRVHIFQWATFYRDTLSEYSDAFLEYLYSAERPNNLLNLVRSAIYHHARDIYSKGFAYVTAHSSSDPDYAITKSLTGLQRFLDLPLEFYSARLADSRENRAALRLRQLCSAMVFGIVHGYASAKLDQAGSQVLLHNVRSWAHVMPFLTSEDLRELMTVLEQGEFTEGIQDSVLPLVQALDMFLEKDPESAPLPALSQYVIGTRRLDVSLQMPPTANGSRLIEVQCYTSAQFVDRYLIEEAAARAVSAVVAPLRSDLRGLVASVERLSDIVVPTNGSGHEVAPQSRLLAVLEEIVYESKSSSLNRPISYNYAAAFPLENPFLTKYNHVYRVSVRRLMQSYERRNGVRLWCSVRRSGKTTACASDLGSTTGQSAIVAQTCDSTGQMADGGVFYDYVKRALVAGQRLDDDFVTRTVDQCLPAAATEDARVVLVLDEYETLFGDLRTSVAARPEIRYAVVQPLLNQLVAFARDNLLILMGQQPNAHYILMDQNQLSPVVEQDTFPLFTHEPDSASMDEFQELLRKVMTSHVDLELPFVDQVYRETGGHPFLTVKLLVSFMDWLIAGKRPVSSVSPVRAELFSEFTESSLTYTAILHNSHYDLFKAAAASHLSPTGRASDPWLHSVYSALRGLALSSPDSLSLSLDDYVALVSRDQVAASPHELLSAATCANFLTFDEATVRPRIPLLARIASAVAPL